VSIIGFNPRTRTGCDIGIPAILPVLEFVSTHAPARGATEGGQDEETDSEVSTHAPARGATCVIRIADVEDMFQPTHPHGVRQIVHSSSSFAVMFQPTHPHGVRRESMGAHTQ